MEISINGRQDDSNATLAYPKVCQLAMGSPEFVGLAREVSSSGHQALTPYLNIRTHRGHVRRQALPDWPGRAMRSPSNRVLCYPITVYLNIRVHHTLWRQRWREVADRYVGIAGDGRIHSDFVGIVPVTAWNSVALEEVDIETCLSEFAVRNETSDTR